MSTPSSGPPYVIIAASALILGATVWFFSSPPKPRPPFAPRVPAGPVLPPPEMPGKPSSSGSDPSQLENAASAPASKDGEPAPAPVATVEELPCDVPPIDGVPEAVVTLDKSLQQDATGGLIPAGSYRLLSARSAQPDRVGGLWTMRLDLGGKGDGAFYRRAGLRRLGSRIRYQTDQARFKFEMVCPDIDKAGMEFFYSLTPRGLRLMTSEGIVLDFERFADSQVAGLPPPPAVPEGKTLLPSPPSPVDPD